MPRDTERTTKGSRLNRDPDDELTEQFNRLGIDRNEGRPSKRGEERRSSKKSYDYESEPDSEPTMPRRRYASPPPTHPPHVPDCPVNHDDMMQPSSSRAAPQRKSSEHKDRRNSRGATPSGPSDYRSKGKETDRGSCGRQRSPPPPPPTRYSRSPPPPPERTRSSRGKDARGVSSSTPKSDRRGSTSGRSSKEEYKSREKPHVNDYEGDTGQGGHNSFVLPPLRSPSIRSPLQRTSSSRSKSKDKETLPPNERQRQDLPPVTSEAEYTDESDGREDERSEDGNSVQSSSAYYYEYKEYSSGQETPVPPGQKQKTRERPASSPSSSRDSSPAPRKERSSTPHPKNSKQLVVRDKPKDDINPKDKNDRNRDGRDGRDDRDRRSRGERHGGPASRPEPAYDSDQTEEIGRGNRPGGFSSRPHDRTREWVETGPGERTRAKTWSPDSPRYSGPAPSPHHSASRSRRTRPDYIKKKARPIYEEMDDSAINKAEKLPMFLDYDNRYKRYLVLYDDNGRDLDLTKPAKWVRYLRPDDSNYHSKENYDGFGRLVIEPNTFVRGRNPEKTIYDIWTLRDLDGRIYQVQRYYRTVSPLDRPKLGENETILLDTNRLEHLCKRV